MPDELVLYVPPGRPWGLVNLSPFCSKLETYLRMAEIPYRAATASMRRAPKGKVPYVALDGALIGDSQLVIETLEGKRATALDAHLDAQQRATGRALRRMLEEGLYFLSVRLRWLDDEGFRHVQFAFRDFLPAPVRPLLPLIRRKVRGMLHGQGTGRHTDDEVVAMAIADLDAVGDLLADRPFLFGDRPTTYDASAFSFVDSMATFPRETAVRAHVRARPNLMAYRQRIRERWFPELPTT